MKGCNCGTVHRHAHAPGCAGFAVEHSILAAEVERLQAERADLERERGEVNKALREEVEARQRLTLEVRTLQHDVDELGAQLGAAQADAVQVALEVEAAAEAALDATLDVGAELQRAQARVAKLEAALERVALCLLAPNPGITDTIWLDPSPRALGPTLFEFVCGALGQEVTLSAGENESGASVGHPCRCTRDGPFAGLHLSTCPLAQLGTPPAPPSA